MDNNIIEYLKNIKRKIKTKDYKIVGKTNDKYYINLQELITRYIIHIYSLQTNNTLYTQFDLLFIPNLEEYDMKNIEFLEFGTILAYIKYDLLCDIDDVLTKNEINQKYLNSYTLKRKRKKRLCKTYIRKY
jgi:hypothetical protein